MKPESATSLPLSGPCFVLALLHARVRAYEKLMALLSICQLLAYHSCWRRTREITLFFQGGLAKNHATSSRAADNHPVDSLSLVQEPTQVVASQAGWLACQAPSTPKGAGRHPKTAAAPKTHTDL